MIKLLQHYNLIIHMRMSKVNNLQTTSIMLNLIVEMDSHVDSSGRIDASSIMPRLHSLMAMNGNPLTGVKIDGQDNVFRLVFPQVMYSGASLVTIVTEDSVSSNIMITDYMPRQVLLQMVCSGASLVTIVTGEVSAILNIIMWISPHLLHKGDNRHF